MTILSPIKLGHTVETVVEAQLDWHGRTIDVDTYVPSSLPGFTTTIMLPDGDGPDAFPPGWHADLVFNDPVASAVAVKCRGRDLINIYWDSAHKHGVYVGNISGDVARIRYLGPSRSSYVTNGGVVIPGWNNWRVDTVSHRAGPETQLTCVSPDRSEWVVSPFCDRKVLACSTVGGQVTLYPEHHTIWCPPDRRTGGNYLSRIWWVQRVGGTAPIFVSPKWRDNGTLIAADLCDKIIGSNDPCVLPDGTPRGGVIINDVALHAFLFQGSCLRYLGPTANPWWGGTVYL